MLWVSISSQHNSNGFMFFECCSGCLPQLSSWGIARNVTFFHAIVAFRILFGCIFKAGCVTSCRWFQMFILVYHGVSFCPYSRRFANCWKISCCKYTNLCMVNGLLIFRVSLVLIRKYFQVFLKDDFTLCTEETEADTLLMVVNWCQRNWVLQPT